MYVHVSRSATIAVFLMASSAVGQENSPQAPPKARGQTENSTWVAHSCDPNAPDFTTKSEISGEMGPDAIKYVDTIRPKVRNSWYSLVGADLWAKKACAVVEFTIRQDGGISTVKLDTSAGDLQLDRAAIAGIVSAAPFAALPAGSSRSGLTIRFNFYYNPGRAPHAVSVRPVTGDRMTASDDEPVSHDTITTSPVVIYSPNPENAPEVIDKDIASNGLHEVQLSVTVTSKGDVAAARITQSLGNGDDEKALALVFMSKLKPATKDGNAVRVEVPMRVRFQ